jgi:hypothetical protein
VANVVSHGISKHNWVKTDTLGCSARPHEIKEFCDDHCIYIIYKGAGMYYVEGDEDYVLFKMAFGI